MKITRGIAVASLTLLVMLAGFSTTSLSSAAANRCTDRCADRYKVRRDACRLIPFKNERKICERRAKEAKEDCKRRCGR